MAKRNAKSITLDAVAKNPALLDTLSLAASARLLRQGWDLIGHILLAECNRLERMQAALDSWPTAHDARSAKRPRRRLRALPGGKAKR